MKFAAIVCLIFALFGLALGLKNADCGLPAAADGNGLIKCAAFIPSYSYHAEKNACEEFTYGGCGGNNNRFPTKEACEEKCKQ